MSIELPKIGLGTWELKAEKCKTAVLNAIKAGYRLIDTAQTYGNEQYVGAAIAESNFPRDELFIATKLFPMNNSPNNAIKSFNTSLKKLRLECVDLLYVHWPAFAYKAGPTLNAISILIDEGKVRNIGISNFTPQLVEEAVTACNKPIFALQVEHHPFLHQTELLNLCGQKGIKFIAYSPLGRGSLMDVPELDQIAKKHEVSVAQVCLAWEMSHNAIPIPKATSMGHLEDNFKAQDLQLDEEDIAAIDGIKTQKRFVNPPFVHPKW